MPYSWHPRPSCLQGSASDSQPFSRWCSGARGSGAGVRRRWAYARAHSPEQRPPARRPTVDMSACRRALLCALIQSRFSEHTVLDAEGLSAWLLENCTLSRRTECAVFEVAKAAYGLWSDGACSVNARSDRAPRSDPFETLLTELQTHIRYSCSLKVRTAVA